MEWCTTRTPRTTAAWKPSWGPSSSSTARRRVATRTTWSFRGPGGDVTTSTACRSARRSPSSPSHDAIEPGRSRARFATRGVLRQAAVDQLRRLGRVVGVDAVRLLVDELRPVLVGRQRLLGRLQLLDVLVTGEPRDAAVVPGHAGEEQHRCVHDLLGPLRELDAGLHPFPDVSGRADGLNHGG